MGAILFYILKSSIYLFVFALLYIWLFRGSTFFRFNRYVFRLGTLLCMILPFASITVDEPSVMQQTMLSISEGLAEAPVVTTVMENSGSNDTPPSAEKQEMITEVLLMVYSLGSATVLFFFSLSFFRLWKLVRHAVYFKEEGFRLILQPKQSHSFSWWRYIIMSEEDYRMSGEAILKHEKAHLRHHHTFDLLWMQCLMVIHWFNPMTWILCRELQELHEYEADEEVLTSGINAIEYQMLLVKKAVGTRLYSMANGFNHSKLKNRISMMLKKRSNGWVRLRVLLSVPVVAGVMYAFAQPEINEVMIQVAPTVAETTADDGLKSIVAFFKEKNDAYWRKRSDADIAIQAKRVHKFYINDQNQVMFDNDYYKGPFDIQKTVTDRLRSLRQINKQESGKDDPHCIYMIYSVDSDKQFVYNALKSIKQAFGNLRAEYVDQGIDNLDEVCPYLVVIKSPSKYGEDGIKVTIGSTDGKQAEQVYNFGKNLQQYQTKYSRQAITTLTADNSANDYVLKNVCAQLNRYFDNVKVVREK